MPTATAPTPPDADPFRDAHPALAAVSDNDWLVLSGRLTDLAGTMSGRGDVIARIGPGLGRGAPACFIPALAEIEIDPVRCVPADDLDRLARAGLAPGGLDLLRRDHRLRVPALTGALAHEAGHAAHSLWQLPEGTGRSAAAAAALLEESRQESAHLRRRPADRLFIRACIARIVAPGFAASPATTRWDAAKAATLLCARADTGLLDDHEVDAVRDQAVAALGPDDYDALRDVWLDAHAAADTDGEALAALGARWCEIVGSDPDGPSPDPDAGAGGCCGGMPETSSDSGSSSGDGPSEDAAPGPLAAAVAAVLGAVAEDAADTVDAEADPSPAAARDAASRAEAARDRADTEAAAERVFAHGYSNTGHTLALTSRPPTAAERASANQIARALAAARYRDRSVTARRSALPPGRLNGRAAVLAAAQREQGRIVTAQPWRSKTRKHVDDPPLSLGIAVDVSGSMGWATGPMASAAWILAQAVERAEGRSATVAFGQAVTAITRPGERPVNVREFPARDGTEEFLGAAKALDGALGLTHGTGARLLVVVSDGHLVGPGQMVGARNYVKRLVASGCGVLWIALAGNGTVVVPPGATRVDLARPDEAGRVIGKAAADALARASA